ncbi:MAG: competence/damage-inducible protein A [Candidatus Baltobacteraceae bacterium]
MPSVEIIAVGTELLLGQLLDTNTAHIAGQLAASGMNVYGTHTVGDNRERIAAAIERALDRADGVITSGGLGPTVDDLTKEAVCDALELPLDLHEPSLRAMEELFAMFGRSMRENNRKQAMMPRGAYVLANPNGSAPGFVAFRTDGKFVASMPGVPSEMRAMLAERLLPWLGERFGSQTAFYTRVLHTIGLGESEIDHRIDELFRTLENPKIGILAHGSRCDVKLMAKASSAEEAEELFAPIQSQIEAQLAGHLYGRDAQTLESVIHERLQSLGQRVAVAESCTGGLICAALTSVPGASQSFLGGVIAYDNSVKTDVLSVDPSTIERFGAVSAEAAAQMAAGAMRSFNADVALATTGIAGPGGGSAEKPVGLVWIALVDRKGHAESRKLQFPGERAVIQARATTSALGLLWRHLGSH